MWLNVIPFYKCPVGQGDGTLPQQVVSFRRNWNRAEKVKIDTNSIMNTRDHNLTLPLWLAQESLRLRFFLQKRQAHHDKVPTGLYQCANVLFHSFVFVPRLSAWERGYLLAQGKLLGPMTLLSIAHNNTSTQCNLPANSSLTVLELCELLQK